MGSPRIPSPDEITLEEFKTALARYSPLIKSVSDAKGAKKGQQTLESLDTYRYKEAPERFGIDGGQDEHMNLEDVKKLVEWKLRHGKFRPTLMKLASSNDASAAQETIQKALAAYKEAINHDNSSSNSKKQKGKASASTSATTAATAASTALDALSTLRGIGPATASLLLAVHDPLRVPFFGDEVFLWLCCYDSSSKGIDQSAQIKYTAKEYRALAARATELTARLGGGGVRAVDVERVAYVLVREGLPQQQQQGDGSAPSPATKAGVGAASAKKDDGERKGKGKEAKVEQSTKEEEKEKEKEEAPKKAGKGPKPISSSTSLPSSKKMAPGKQLPPAEEKVKQTNEGKKKRKQAPEPEPAAVPLRRSKRGKQA